MEEGRTEKCFGGKWRLVEVLGEGSYGRVYRAEREDFGQTYCAAIKMITIPHSPSEVESVYSELMTYSDVTDYFRKYVEQLVEEFKIMSVLKGSSNIVNYEDHEVIPHEDGIGWDIYIRMELLKPLTKRIREGMKLNDILRLGIDICKALELCRTKNIIHRDIKPENIFVSEFGDYKLGDFGIARTLIGTSSGLSRKGTYAYMAPEVYKEQSYGATADIYSLGILLYRLLNKNRTPFLPPPPRQITNDDKDEAIKKQMQGTVAMPPPSEADPLLSKIILKACAYAPQDRYQTPTELRGALENVQRLYQKETLNRDVIFEVGDASQMTRKTASIGGLSKSTATPAASPKRITHSVSHSPSAPSAPPTPPAALPEQSEKQRPLSFWQTYKKWIFIAVGIVLISLILIIAIFGSSKNEKTPEIDRLRSETPKESEPSDTIPLREAGEWTEDLPVEAYLSGTPIETELLYRSSPVVVSDQADSSLGTLCSEEKIIIGSWSEWQDEEIVASDTLEVETRTLSYYRTRYSRTVSNSTHTSTWTEYGWSGWKEYTLGTDNIPSAAQTQTKQQYRSRAFGYQYCYASDWSDWSSDPIVPAEDLIVEIKQMYRTAAEEQNERTESMEHFAALSYAPLSLTDIHEDDWFYASVQSAVNSRLMMPDKYLAFRPNEHMTIGEVICTAAMINRIYHGESAVGVSNGRADQAFFSDALSRRIVKETEFADLNAEATRADVAAILYRSLPETEYEKINFVTSITDMSPDAEYYGYVKKLAEAGVFGWAKPDGAFSPDSSITRAQFATMIDRMVYPAHRVG